MMRAAIGWAVVACACGGAKTAPKQPETLANKQPAPLPAAAPVDEPPMVAMQRFTDEMCRCVDPDCARRVSDDMTKWGQEMAAKYTDPPKMSEDEQRRAVAIGTHMGECMQKAMSVP